MRSTGKTHLTRYLTSHLPDHTVVVLPGRTMGNIGRLPEITDLCQPGIVVLDVDHMAQQRHLSHPRPLRAALRARWRQAGCRPPLRLDHEPGRAPRSRHRRPTGRVDQAVHIPPPDADCRRRLLTLYAKGVTLEADEAALIEVIERTDGVTASFFKELMRRATMKAIGHERPQPGARPIVAGAICRTRSMR